MPGTPVGIPESQDTSRVHGQDESGNRSTRSEQGVCVEKFVPRFQGRPWADGLRVLHVYVLPRPGVDDGLLSLAQM